MLFLSEIGVPIPGLLWRPVSTRGVIVLAHEGGKAVAAESGLVEPLLRNGLLADPLEEVVFVL